MAEKPPAAPRGLGTQGRQLWKSVVAEFELESGEARVLAQACAAADELARLKVELDQSPVVVAGSTGQPKPHPLFGEVRAHRAQLVALLKQLGLTVAEDDSAQGAKPSTVRALTAARARWGEGRVMG